MTSIKLPKPPVGNLYKLKILNDLPAVAKEMPLASKSFSVLRLPEFSGCASKDSLIQMAVPLASKSFSVLRLPEFSGCASKDSLIQMAVPPPLKGALHEKPTKE
ncbi:hypothetical protein QE152_g25630 [Popillia japonica]|uniref:Uncharacterized protein n=1 Tax=Popillia japonica TaxID=7064 RepID=A0AAW1JZE9_POPJA